MFFDFLKNHTPKKVMLEITLLILVQRRAVYLLTMYK